LALACVLTTAIAAARLPTVALAKVGGQDTDLSRLWEAAARAPRDADVQNRLGEALERIGALDAALDT